MNYESEVSEGVSEWVGRFLTTHQHN